MSERNDSTCTTAPWHIWIHEVEMAAIALGADGQTLREIRPAQSARLSLWYRSGEPVWLAADGLAKFVAGAARAKRCTDNSRQTIRAAHRASLKQNEGK